MKGRVRYQCLKPRAVERVEVKFWGRVKTTISEKNNLSGLYNQYRDRVCLFEDNLISGVNTTLATGVHNWPFAFTFPTTAAPREVKSWDSKRTEKQLPETVLPPSFQLNAQGLLTGYYSFIAYSLVACVHFSDRSFSLMEVDFRHLDGPPRDFEADLSLHLSMASTRACASRTEPSLGSREVPGAPLIAGRAASRNAPTEFRSCEAREPRRG